MPINTLECVPQEVSKFTRVCVYERGRIGEAVLRLNTLLASAEEIKNAPPISPIPLIVLSAESENPEAEEKLFLKVHNELQNDLVRISPQGKLVIVKNSGHFIQKDRPDVVIDAINTIYKMSKQSPTQ